MDAADEYIRIAKEHYREMRAEATGKFGIVDLPALSETQATLDIAKVRANAVRFDFKDHQATYEMANYAALSAAKAKYNSRLILQRIRQIGVLLLLTFVVVAATYFDTWA